MKARIQKQLPALFLLLIAACLVPLSTWAGDVPAVINYQGKLTDNLGNAVTSGYYHIEFRIWDHPTLSGAGDLIWGRMFPLHVMAGGIFNVLLSDDGGAVSGSTPQTNDLRQAFADEDRYLGLTITETPAGAVGSPVEISPRQRFVSGPYAFHAENATLAELATLAVDASSAAFASDAAAASAGFTVHGGLTVSSGELTASEVAKLNGGLEVHGSTALAGSVGIGGATVISNTLHVTGNLSVASPSMLEGYGSIPIGGIIIWSGAESAIPDGWALCDGDSHSGHATPNLRDRFVVGAGSAYAVTDTGGAATVTLSINEIPSHNHSYTYRDESEGYAAIEASHGYWKNTKSESTGHTGGGAAHENRPPYYALCYIMRVK